MQKLGLRKENDVCVCVCVCVCVWVCDLWALAARCQPTPSSVVPKIKFVVEVWAAQKARSN